jgi:hypothetical protein
MLPRSLFAAVIILCCVVLVQAAVIRGKVKSTDADKNTITVTVDDKEQTIAVAKDVRVTQPNPAKNNKKRPLVDVPGGLKGLSSGNDVVITTYKNEGKDEAAVIHVDGPAKKKKKN